MLKKVILKNKMYLFFIVTLPVIIAEKTKKSEDKKINIDKKHLAEHFVDLYGLWTDIFSEKEMDLQYFSSHDFDGNEKLDGLELFNALNHEIVSKEENLGREQLEKDTENEVDAIFSKYDVDNDGFKGYRKSMKSRAPKQMEQKAQFMKIHEYIYYKEIITRPGCFKFSYITPFPRLYSIFK